MLASRESEKKNNLSTIARTTGTYSPLQPDASWPRGPNCAKVTENSPQMSPGTITLFQLIDCPLCGTKEFDVVKEGSYPTTIPLEDVKQRFHASSDHELLDQVVRCRRCALIYVNPRIDARVLTSGYSDAED